jgi:hypothetical protein
VTDFLFAIPSFLSGVARVVDLGGRLDDLNSSPTPEATDFHASTADWNMIARDLLAAARLVAAEDVQEEEAQARS